MYWKNYLFCKTFWRTKVLFVGPLIPLFWTSGDVYFGFQRQSGQPNPHLAEAYVMYCFKNENENPSVDFLPNNYLIIKIVISMQDKFYCVTKWKETEQCEAVRIPHFFCHSVNMSFTLHNIRGTERTKNRNCNQGTTAMNQH